MSEIESIEPVSRTEKFFDSLTVLQTRRIVALVNFISTAFLWVGLKHLIVLNGWTFFGNISLFLTCLTFYFIGKPLLISLLTFVLYYPMVVINWLLFGYELDKLKRGLLVIRWLSWFVGLGYFDEERQSWSRRINSVYGYNNNREPVKELQLTNKAKIKNIIHFIIEKYEFS